MTRRSTMTIEDDRCVTLGVALSRKTGCRLTRAAAALERQGVRVLPRRQADPLASGLAIVAGAVVIAVVAGLIAKGR